MVCGGRHPQQFEPARRDASNGGYIGGSRSIVGKDKKYFFLKFCPTIVCFGPFTVIYMSGQKIFVRIIFTSYASGVKV